MYPTKGMAALGLALLGSAAFSTAPARAASVLPAGLVAVEGNSAAENPFAAFGRRYQQVYNAAAFADGPVSITGLSFRADGSLDGPVDSSRGLPDFPVVFRLSTTEAGADALSSVFDDNVGADAATVFSGVLPLQSDAAAGTPNDFSFTFAFDSAFSYDPAAGNLLLEVSKFSADLDADAVLFDAEDTLGDGVSSLVGLSPDAAQGLASSLGLVTRFTTAGDGGPVPVPTPGAAGLGLAMLGLGAARRRRQAAV